MVIILWGLVFAKCLTLEYLIQIYSIPINSLVYIWMLTLIMASLATVAFFRAKATEDNRAQTISVIQLMWCGCCLICVLLVGVLSLLTELNPYAIPTILSLILGVGYFFHGILIRKNISMLGGLGWWIGSAVLATRNNVESLSILAFLMILLVVLPLIIEMRQQKAFI